MFIDETERERERGVDGCLTMCPDRGSNMQPFGVRGRYTNQVAQPRSLPFINWIVWCCAVCTLYIFWTLTSYLSCSLQESLPIRLVVLLFCRQLLALGRRFFSLTEAHSLFLPLLPLSLGSNSQNVLKDKGP